MRCLRRLAVALIILLASYTALISVGHGAAGAEPALAPAALTLPALVAVAIACAVRRYRRRSGALVLHFDGRDWGCADGRALVVESSYLSTGLLAIKVVVGGQRHRLLLTRGQLSRECWRRLRLGLTAAQQRGAQSP